MSQATDASSSFGCSPGGQVPARHSLRPRRSIKYASSDSEETNPSETPTPPSRAAYMRRYRKSWTPEQREKHNSKARRRMVGYRYTKKKCEEPLTRQGKVQQRRNWKDQKQTQRDSMTPQQKDAYNSKRRLTYAKNKSDKFRLHNSPTKFADQVDELISNATPRKRAALVSRGIIPPTEWRSTVRAVANLRSCLKDLKKSRFSKDKQKYKLIVSSVSGKDAADQILRKKLEVRYNMWRDSTCLDEDSQSRKKRSDSLAGETVFEIEQFYSKYATIVNNTKIHTKDGQPKQILDLTTSKLHKRFSTEIGLRVSLSKFRKMRPGFVLTVKNHRFNQCLCEYCVNVDEKLKVLVAHLQKSNFTSSTTLSNKFDLVNLTLCPKIDGKPHRQLDCIKRLCSDCSPCNLSRHLKPFLDEAGDQEIKWSVWVTEKFVTKGTQPKNPDKAESVPKTAEVDEEEKAVKYISKKVLHDSVGSLSTIVSELEHDLKTFPEHLFVAQWQRTQLQTLKSNLPESWILCIEDYAENFRTVFQDEPQSAHFHYQQATMFTVVSYYKCLDCVQQVEHSTVFVSDDIVHDAQAVAQMETALEEHLQKQGHSFEHKVVFSDGCGSQFKSKVPFSFVAKTPHLQRAYFGTRHGKSSCDALGGIVKNTATKHVLARQG